MSRPSRLTPHTSSLPCPYPAGSPGKIAALRERVARRQPLFHAEDNRAIAGRVSCSTSDDALIDAMRLFAPIEAVALGTAAVGTNNT